MNTDAILDFVVENYIWFIVGGVVIILAILGIVAEKKKIIPKKKKKEEAVEELVIENNSDTEKIGAELNNENEIQNDAKIGEAIEINDFEQPDNKLEIYEPSEINSEQDIVINNKPIDIIDEADVVIDDNTDDIMVNNDNHTINSADEINDANISDRINYADIDNEIINEINSRQAVIDSTEKSDNNISIFNNQYKNPDSVSDFDSPKLGQTNNENELSDVDADINRINNLRFSDDETKIENNQKSEEKLEDTMQISYAQLKEIVQDIIAENEAEEKLSENKIAENQIENKENIVEKQEVSTAADTTYKDKNQQADEDDVWKF